MKKIIRKILEPIVIILILSIPVYGYFANDGTAIVIGGIQDIILFVGWLYSD